MHWLAIALGGAAGATLRAFLVGIVAKQLPSAFPFGTMLVNVLGSFAIGIAYYVIVERAQLGPYAKDLLMVGFLGGLTTFSSYSLDALLLIKQGMVLQALIYVLSTVLICLLAVVAGLYLSRLVFN